MAEVYKHLRRQRFPALGHSLYVLSPAPRNVNTSCCNSRPDSNSNSRRSSSVFRRLSLARDMGRRGSSSVFNRILNKQSSSGSTSSSSCCSGQQLSCHKKRIRRPIDFRLDGAPICQIFSKVEDILLLYSSVLLEKRILVISSSLRWVPKFANTNLWLLCTGSPTPRKFLDEKPLRVWKIVKLPIKSPMIKSPKLSFSFIFQWLVCIVRRHTVVSISNVMASHFYPSTPCQSPALHRCSNTVPHRSSHGQHHKVYSAKPWQWHWKSYIECVVSNLFQLANRTKSVLHAELRAILMTLSFF